MIRGVADRVIEGVVSRLWASPALAARLIRLWFLPEPTIEFDDDQRAAFEACYDRAVDSRTLDLAYDLPYPKHEFLAYLAQEKPVLFHGSNDTTLATLEPRQQVDHRGEPVTAVFATSDPHWATFFAIVDRDSYTDSLRNAGFLVETPSGTVRRYYFSLSRRGLRAGPFSTGALYVLPDASFDPPEVDVVGMDEWHSATSVTPVARIEVHPDEFYFLNDVVGHREDESMPTSWVSYHWRRHRGRSR